MDFSPMRDAHGTADAANLDGTSIRRDRPASPRSISQRPTHEKLPVSTSSSLRWPSSQAEGTVFGLTAD
ncbi:MAG: hypothetical protein U5O39_19500 [Gammaproteobacteria bacterium]|nr:hypothetical protein [Gammaproteobacteria bacterium]